MTLERTNLPALDEILGKDFPVLDKGFVRVIDYMGSDDSVVQSARVSYGRGTKTSLEDAGLIDFLMMNHHTTPFEACTIKLHVKCPIFVARQWLRHRTQSYNEYSARYSIVDKDFYLPDLSRVAKQSSTNKQGSGEALQEEQAEDILTEMLLTCQMAYDYYQDFMTDRGVSRELARIILPQNMYTEFYTVVNLHNLLNFVRLRADKHSQFEIRAYAEVIVNILKLWCPMSYKSFVNHVLEGRNLSRDILALLTRKLKGEKITFENSGLSKREWNSSSDLLLL